MKTTVINKTLEIVSREIHRLTPEDKELALMANVEALHKMLNAMKEEKTHA